MSTDRAQKPQTEQTTDTPPQNAVEEWVEQVGSYWGRAIASAWRTVFPPREDPK